jgi:hypothetical protein
VPHEESLHKELSLSSCESHTTCSTSCLRASFLHHCRMNHLRLHLCDTYISVLCVCPLARFKICLLASAWSDPSFLATVQFALTTSLRKTCPNLRRLLPKVAQVTLKGLLGSLGRARLPPWSLPQTPQPVILKKCLPTPCLS